MRPRFEVQFTINRGLMKIFAGYSSTRWAFRLRRILFLALGCLELFLASLNGFHSILPVIIGLLSLLLAVFYSQYLQWWYWRRNKPKAETAVVYSFFDDRFTAVSGTLSQSAQYDDLFEVVETKEVFGLKRDKNGAVILPKCSFTIGSPDDFRAFIEEKTGKKIKFIR